MSSKAQEQTDLGGTAFQENEFSSLLQKEFKPKSDHVRDEVQNAVKTLAAHALEHTQLISDDTIKTGDAGGQALHASSSTRVSCKVSAASGVDS